MAVIEEQIIGSKDRANNYISIKPRLYNCIVDITKYLLSCFASKYLYISFSYINKSYMLDVDLKLQDVDKLTMGMVTFYDITSTNILDLILDKMKNTKALKSIEALDIYLVNEKIDTVHPFECLYSAEYSVLSVYYGACFTSCFFTYNKKFDKSFSNTLITGLNSFKA